ncbi:hypothetical protein DSM106972_047050 [Dulcicalothrix desertica PCC 7102]|uniref:Uncharacterized protein n=2 Tax=Dulcicalothrix desertica TaxID=32056 RepID=A0A433VCF1_9CYAN|nr:hypothetical protein DSM106972_047050 [Dulcicalothrix desertica PCC 7102]TWH43801.1 hypothetical protein CAL7102_07545 [Dulcicalothrix desertica PCC 7102]
MLIIVDLPMPDDKIVRLVRYFHLSLGLFLLISVLFLNGCSNTNANGVKIRWSNTEKVPASLMRLAIADNTSLSSTARTSIQVSEVGLKDQDNRLYLFNYNDSRLCGRLGCLYTGYINKGKNKFTRVINLYLQPKKAPGENLISIKPNNFGSTSNIPCLDIQQLNDNRTLQKITYCDEGGYYQAVENSFLKLPTSTNTK